ncbi:MAG TPA: metallo-mystery pair system four-Cys motif protein [Nannocystis exedens]|nr:metallo-mystery pair system four-Cys motif protein [Nannocystis exedens]
MRRFSLPLVALSVPLLLSCSDDRESQTITLRFAPMVGDADFACGQSYPGLGTTGATVQANDFRLYLHDITLLHSDGSREPLELDESEWQSGTVALLDFEDASGECVGSPQTNLEITGQRSDDSEITGVEFTLGVPEAQNHLDSASAASPLNIPGMYWSWLGGYKYLRVDLTTSGGEPFVFHLGATGCAGDTAEGYTCSHGNRISLAFDNFDPTTDRIAVDLAALVESSDLTTANDIMEDPVEGCMSGPGDPECAPLFISLGLEHGSTKTHPEAQTVFQVLAQP